MNEHKQRICVTGGSGILGSHLLESLDRKKFQITAVYRNDRNSNDSSIRNIMIRDLSSQTDWSSALQDIDIIVHTAARVHIQGASSLEDLKKYREVNTVGTINLAKQAVQAGVKRFIFISTIKVNGESTIGSQVFTGEGAAPEEPYAISKYEAELALKELTKQSDMELVIIRPPLVYGTGVKANFASLISLVKKIPILPFGSVNCRRSFIAIDNLVDFVTLCADRQRSPMAANQTFVISDDEDVSITELIRKLAVAYEKRLWLLPIPVYIMKLLGTLMGKKEVVSKLFDSLRVDCSKAKNLLDWEPVITMDEQLKKMADAEK